MIHTDRRPTLSVPDALPLFSKACLLAALLVVTILPGHAGRAVPGAEDDLSPEIRQVLDRLDEAYEGLDSYRARIVETRELALLADEQRLAGELLYSVPGRVRWEYTEPEHRIYLLRDEELIGWIPGQNVVEKVELGRYRRRAERMLGVGRGAEGLVEEFEISLGASDDTLDADHLVLEPRSRRVRRRIERLHMWIDRQTGMTRRIGYEIPSGDRVRIDFLDIERNPEIAEGAFRLDVPAGARVVEGESSFGIPGLTERD